MYRRKSYHILFWIFYLCLISISDALFPAASDKDLTFVILYSKYFAMNLLFLPWKIIPFYVLFYLLVPKYFPSQPWKIGVLFFSVLVICVLSYRSTMMPITSQFYGDKMTIDVFEFRRILYSIIEFIPPIALASVIKLFTIYIANGKKLTEISHLKTEMELSLMKAHFNPHFLFNTLNNLYGLARANNEHTPDYILKLSDIMRSVLDGSTKRFVPLSSEIKLIEDYLALEKMRYDDRLNISFEYDKNIKAKIAPMILLTFVENAFKHGVSEISQNCFVKIDINIENNVFHFFIGNSSFSENQNPERGIINARKQLQLIYGNDHTLAIGTTPSTYQVNLTIKDFSKYVE